MISEILTYPFPHSPASANPFLCDLIFTLFYFTLSLSLSHARHADIQLRTQSVIQQTYQSNILVFVHNKTDHS